MNRDWIRVILIGVTTCICGYDVRHSLAHGQAFTRMTQSRKLDHTKHTDGHPGPGMAMLKWRPPVGKRYRHDLGLPFEGYRPAKSAVLSQLLYNGKRA